MYDYQNLSLPEQNAFKYICGYLIEKCLRVHKCPVCNTFARDDGNLNETNIFIHFKAYNTKLSFFGGLKTPHESFYFLIYKLEKLFVSNIESCVTTNPGKILYDLLLKEVDYVHPCKLFPYVYLVKLYIRFRIYYLLKYTNIDCKTAPRKNRKLVILMNL